MSIIDEVMERREYFVSVVDGNRSRMLLGPYPDHATALENVSRGRELAEKADPRAWFYAFGTCSAPVGIVLKTLFGS